MNLVELSLSMYRRLQFRIDCALLTLHCTLCDILLLFEYEHGCLIHLEHF